MLLPPDDIREHLRKVYSERGPDLVAFAYRLTGSTSAAEDVVHEGFLRVLDGRCRVDRNRGELQLLLFGIVRNIVRERTRVTTRHVLTSSSVHETEGAARSVPEHVLAVKAAINALSESDREVVILSAYHGYTPREIARILHTSSLLVRVRLHRARERLRQRLHGLHADRRTMAVRSELRP